MDAERVIEMEDVYLKKADPGDWQEISLSFEDAAGNRGTADTCRVLLTTDWGARIMHRKHIWLPILLAAAFVVIIAVRRKKEGKKNEA